MGAKQHPCPSSNNIKMRKIEIYDKYCVEIGKFDTDDILVTAMRKSCAKALQANDIKIVEILAYNQVNKWLLEATQRERQGEHIIPEYIWDAAVEYLETTAHKLGNEEHLLHYHAPETTKEKEIKKAIKALEEEEENEEKNGYNIIDSEFRHERCLKLWEQLYEIRETNPHALYPFYGLDWINFKKTYFDGVSPNSYNERNSATRELSRKYISYAQQLREANL